MKIFSFHITGQFASFKDPSVTSNQLVYYIPSKTAVVGILGSILGVRRSDTLDDLYSQDFLDLFSKVRIGLEVQNNPRKITYFTNHRSLKEDKTKPVKKEVLEHPKYVVYVKSTEDVMARLDNAIRTGKYHFTPYLGHAYCLAKITEPTFHDAKRMEMITGEETCCVVLDETETYNENFVIDMSVKRDDGGIIIIERHLHHFIGEGELQKRVLKHWIPLDSTLCKLEEIQENKLSEFYKIKGSVVCLY